MNKTIGFLALLCILLFTASCGENPQKTGPSPTAKAFLSALQNGDHDRAKDYCTPDSRDKLNWLQTFSGMGANPYSEPFQIEREELSGDYARVYYTQGDDGKEKMIKLRNTTGKWEVIASKNDLSAEEESAPGFSSNEDDEMDLGEDLNKEFEEGLENLTETFGEVSRSLDMDLDDDPAEDTGVKYKTLRDGKSPADIAQEFLTALKYSDYEGAKQFASARTAEVLDMKSGLSSEEKFGDFKLGKTDLEGRYATVHYLDAKGQQQKVKLGQDSQGNWEVIMTKTDFKDMD